MKGNQVSVLLTMMTSNDTLTGGGTVRRCNWMFLEHLKHCNSWLYDVPMYIQDAKFVSQLLSEKGSEKHTVIPYKTTKHGVPPIRSELTTFSSSTDPQHKRSIIHVLARADRNSDCPALTEQTIPSYSGCHASLNVEHGKCKAYFHFL